ncbi:DNA adenine methylase [Salinicola halophyticus]|uniref:DNA adenine methylase n=1 Tax=Salinicola halophyticus TaxID=1808881 RepID=UPI003F48F550
MSQLPPVLRYHGGKWRIADWVVSHFPHAGEYDTYIEPFGGSASVLMRKPRSQFEVYNDLDSEIVNVFRVLRDPESAQRLFDLLMLTPYARDEFDLTYREESPDPVEQARRTVFRAFSGFGSAAATKGRTGFRGFSGSNGRGVNPAGYWSRYPDNLSSFCERLVGVVIENRSALDVMRDRDGERVLHYVDPPYVTSSRVMQAGDRYYRHEMTDSQHVDLLDLLNELEGFVVLSGYRSPLYADRLKGWESVECQTTASGRLGSVQRTECLWLSPRVVDAILRSEQQADMFSEVAL